VRFRRCDMADIQLEIEPADSINAPSFTQGGFIARLIDCTNDEEIRAYQSLRYEHFVLRKGWVGADPSRPGRETDRYDSHCHHLGVFEGQHLVAYLRVLPWQDDSGFMLEHEFRDLVPVDAVNGLRREGTVEISRLIVVPPPGTGRSQTAAIAELLFKLVYGLGKRLGWAAYCIVVEEAWLRILNRRFEIPFAPLGEIHTYADGTRTLAAQARCDAAEQSMLETSPDKYGWYRQDTAG
jgi:N-acyl-L-homoserine lactone synthetase